MYNAYMFECRIERYQREHGAILMGDSRSHQLNEFSKCGLLNLVA